MMPHDLKLDSNLVVEDNQPSAQSPVVGLSLEVTVSHPSASLVRRSFVAFLCLLTILASSTLSGAASGGTSGSFSARLTKTSFTSAQTSSVKLVCKFKKKSGSFSYALTLKKGKKWQTVKRVKKVSYRKGSYTTTVKKVFAGKAVKLGSYRLKVSAGKSSQAPLASRVEVEARYRPRPVASLPTPPSHHLRHGQAGPDAYGLARLLEQIPDRICL